MLASTAALALTLALFLHLRLTNSSEKLNNKAATDKIRGGFFVKTLYFLSKMCYD